MLKVYNGELAYPLSVDDYYVKEMFNGLDELIFEISIWDDNYKYLIEEATITEGGGQNYLIKSIDAGLDTAKIKAQLDLDAFSADIYIPYTNSSATAYDTVSSIIPSGWKLIDKAAKSIRRTIELDYATPLDIIEACRDTYGITARYDNIEKTVTLIDPDSYQPMGAIIARELNMTELNYKGKSTDLVTRLYAYGKDGLSFADINNGLPYVENFTYDDRVICGYWSDNRYTNAESLLQDAIKTLEQMAVPQRSYQCSVVDLAETNPEMYAFEDFSLFQVVTFIEPTMGQKINYQVVEYWRYPYYPEKNTVTLSSETPKIQNQVKHIQSQIENPSSSFRTQMQNSINNATAWLAGTNGGYIVIHQDAQKQPYEILIMDSPNIETAQKIWRWNLGGLGFSSNGYDGPYETAITQDGAIVANFITAGILTASIIKAGVLQSVNGACTIDMETGNCKMTGTFTSTNDFLNGSRYEQGGTGFSIFNNVNGSDTYIGGTALYVSLPSNDPFVMTRAQNFQIYDWSTGEIKGGLHYNGGVTELGCERILDYGDATIDGTMTTNGQINANAPINANAQINANAKLSANSTFSFDGYNVEWQQINVNGEDIWILARQ